MSDAAQRSFYSLSGKEVIDQFSKKQRRVHIIIQLVRELQAHSVWNSSKVDHERNSACLRFLAVVGLPVMVLKSIRIRIKDGLGQRKRYFG